VPATGRLLGHRLLRTDDRLLRSDDRLLRTDSRLPRADDRLLRAEGLSHLVGRSFLGGLRLGHHHPEWTRRLLLGGRGLVGRREARRGRVGEREQLLGQRLGVVHDPLTLSPDAVGLGIELLQAPFGGGGDLSRLLARSLESFLGVAARLRGDL
jgi:hypothetical protein